MSLFRRIARARAEFVVGCGFAPDRVVIPAEDLGEFLECSAVHAGDRLFGMRMEIGDRLQCRAERLAD